MRALLPALGFAVKRLLGAGVCLGREMMETINIAANP
jgi:hypothetical protein